MLFILKFKKI